MVDSNTDFAFKFYKEIISADRRNGKNINFSPLSISTAFGMLHAGAKGNTDTEIANVMSYTQEHNELHPSFGYLIDDLSSGNDASFNMNIVNGVWLEKTFEIKDNYAEILTDNYFAAIDNLDFMYSPDESRTEINDWVSTNTNDKIKDLFPKNSIDNSTKMVLANAVYFNASWKKEFQLLEYDFLKKFTLSSGDIVTTDMMKQTEYIGYAESDKYQVAELTYDGADISMVLLLPKGDFSDFEKNMTAASYKTVIASIEDNVEVYLTFPKFKFSTDINLLEVLMEMGMNDAFTSDADFSGINQDINLYVSGAFHKAFIDVNEKGTEAAAATGISVGATSSPDYFEMMVNKPFMFFIRDKLNGSILFMGRINNPVE